MTEQSPASCAEVKNKCRCTAAPPPPYSWHGPVYYYQSVLECPHYLLSNTYKVAAVIIRHVTYHIIVLIPVIICNKVLKLATLRAETWYKLCSICRMEDVFKVCKNVKSVELQQ